MDFYDIEDEREKENMELIIDGLKIEIPEELVQERIELMDISSEEVREILIHQANKYKKCLTSNGKYNVNTFESKFVAYLDSEMDVYRL